jgi:rod shape-determining protein MreC
MFGFFEIDVKKLLLVALILALPLISINLERRDNSNIRWYDQPVFWVVNSTQDLFSRFALGVAHTTSHYLNLLDIKKENRLLKEDIAKLKQELMDREEVKLENDRLKNLVDFRQVSPSKMLAAQVIGIDLWNNSEYTSLKINKGSTDGLRKGMGVITREGVVGYLLNTQPDYSTVLAITDRNAVADAVVQRSRARGIVEGMGGDFCRVKYLQRTDDVVVGDLVVSGFEGIFPKGFPIGVVTKVSKKAFGVTQTVELRPVVDARRLEEVFVVMKPVDPPPAPETEVKPEPKEAAKESPKGPT